MPSSRKIFFFFFLFLSVIAEAGAETVNNELREILDGVSKSFDFPVEKWLHNTTDSRVNQELSCDASFSIAKENKGDGYFPILNADIKFIPLGYWFAETILFYYTEQEEQGEWEPDFVYRFGYEDWRPYTFNLVYSNYTGNRSIHDVYKQHDRGSYSLTWNLPVPNFFAKPFLIEPEKEVNSTIGMIYSTRYTTIDGKDRYDKVRGTISFSAPLYKNLHLNFNFYYYLDNYSQQPWDPDYTYEITWRGEYFSIAYKNYGGTRFPWRSDLPHDSDFTDGSIGITWYWDLFK